MKNTKKKFKIMYPKDYHDPNKRNKPYYPPQKHMIVMNESGVFFLLSTKEQFIPIVELKTVLPKYDVIWK